MCKNYFHLFFGVKKMTLAGCPCCELLCGQSFRHDDGFNHQPQQLNERQHAMHTRFAMITFLDNAPTDPGFGNEAGGGHPGGGPVYPPGHPSAGLPIQPGHPSGGFPVAPGHPDAGLPGHGHPGNRPPNVPPNVTWPPQMPNRPSNELPPELSGNRPTNPIHLPEGSQLPTDAAFVAVYTVNKGWSSAVIKAPPTAGTPPTGASPK